MFENFREKLPTRKKEKESKKKDREFFIEQAIKFINQGHPGVAREYFKKAGFKDKEIDLLISEQTADKTIKEQPIEQEQSARLIPEDKDKLRLAKLGGEAIKKGEFYFAGACLMGAGYSEEAVRPLFELAEFLKENKRQDQKVSKEQIELTPKDKIRLKQLALTFVAKNQAKAAESCFKRAGVTEGEIRSLLELNLLGIDEEKNKLAEELKNLKQQESE